MHQHVYLISPTVPLIFFVALFSLASLVHAESVVWNKTETIQLCGDGFDFGCVTQLFNPAISITYHAQVKNTATGEVFSCDVAHPITVPVGTPLSLQFIPHEYTDVYWFGTGGSNDSPYGEWRGDAALGPGPYCQPKDKYADAPPYSVLISGYIKYTANAYATLVVAPPAKNITGADNLHCSNSVQSNLACTPTTAGTSNVIFDFAPTTAKFYSQYDGDIRNASCWADQKPMSPFTGNSNKSDQPYILNVPSQHISCPITVTAAPENPEAHAPSVPSLSSQGACVVGTAHAVNFVSTDPDNDNLKYGIDWDGSGSVDQWIPGTGFVASGSTQTASRSYALAGSKTVKVLAQDTNGLSSGWASISFTCADSATAALNVNDGSGDNDEGGNGGGAAQLLADLDLRVIPSLVRSGDTTKVNWSASNVSSCNVSAHNGDAWSGLLSALGGNISKPITGETTYTLSCIDLEGDTQTKQATVRIIPTFQEL